MSRIQKPTQGQLDELKQIERQAKTLDAQALVDSIDALRGKITDKTTTQKFEIWLIGLRARLQGVQAECTRPVSRPQSQRLTPAQIEAHNRAIVQRRSGQSSFSLVLSRGRKKGL